MSRIKFLDTKGTFQLDNPENYSYLYFPVAGEKGIKSAVTPNLGGDSKLNQNAFILEPVSSENLHNNRSSRNFWCVTEKGCWSVVGQSAEAEAQKFTNKQEPSQITAGLMWQTITRESAKYGLKSAVTSFVPLEHNVEVMQVEITNTSDAVVKVTPVAAVPIYGRSADNIRDHRHVTSLLHRIRTTDNGVYVRPTLSFDERGHQKNNLTYFVWPFITTKLYMDQTGDVEILNQKVAYFKDRQVERGTATDEEWTDEYGKVQKTVTGEKYEGTILEHLLLQNLCAFYEVGEHNHIRLRGADWNDALDMAPERGESVAFTCAYAGNLKQLASYIRMLKRKHKQNKIELLEEMVGLLSNDDYIYDDIDKKLAVLNKYVKQCRHNVSGARVLLDAELVAQNLDRKAEWIMQNVRNNEWVTDSKGNGWFNSYYDNNGNRVEGENELGVRMMLTGQVFALMSKLATTEQAKQIAASAKEYLYKKEVGGYRINTNFHEEKYDMGRMFGFAYGEKENGAVFSHMTVMYANALYQNGMVREGYEALQTLADTSLDFDTSYMYPGIPEYFNASGRGMYSYLTGAASWYMLTVVTEAFGVKGENGNLVLEPKLVKEQFDENGEAAVELIFADRQLTIKYVGAKGKDFGQYKIASAVIDGADALEVTDTKVEIARARLESLDDSAHEIVVKLN